MTRDEKSDRVWLEQIGEFIDEIRAYTGGTTNTSEQSRETQRAVERVLQILAESTQRLSPAVKATEPQIPWGKIAGLRNRLVHGYLYIDQETIRAIVEEDLPPLEEALQRMTRRVAKIESLPRAPQESVAAEHAATADHQDASRRTPPEESAQGTQGQRE